MRSSLQQGGAVWLRRVALALGLFVLAAAWVTIQAVRSGEAEMERSNAAFDAGDLYRASSHARRAATYYAPGAPHVAAAYDRLRAIAVGAEAAGDVQSALFAWRAMRGAAVETKHLFLTHPKRLASANEAIARLEARLSDPKDAQLEKGQRSVALKRLGRDETPRGGWILVLGLGFFLCLLGLFWLAARGFDGRGRASLSKARFGLMLCLAGAALWTLASYMA
jgi:hypothetical protein